MLYEVITIVFSKIAVDDSMKQDFKIDKQNYKKEIKTYTRNKEIDKNIKDRVRKLMWENAAIVRDKESLQKAFRITSYNVCYTKLLRILEF